MNSLKVNAELLAERLIMAKNLSDTLNSLELWKQVQIMLIGMGEMMEKVNNMDEKLDKMYREWEKSQ